MKKLLTTSLTALGVLAGSVLLAPAAQAITNPASNPYPSVVKGDDGKTYEDGRDTLPGYDDEECSYIPGAWFDFDNNRVHYADGQSIPWTEWERIPGYKEWLAKQKEEKEDPAPSGGSSSGSTGKTGGSSSGKSGGSSQGKSGSSGSGTSGTGAAGQSGGGTGGSDASGATGTTATDDPTVTATDESGDNGKKRAKREGAAEGEAADESVDTVDGTFVATTSDDDTQAAAQSGNGSGLLILASLLVGGLALVGGYGVFGRRRRQKTS